MLHLAGNLVQREVQRMATINSRSDQDGNVIGWQAIVRKRGFPSQTRTFRTKRDAERWAREAETDMERGVFVSRKEGEYGQRG